MIQTVGKHLAFQKALQDATLAAQRNAPVLIYGETGTGKGMLAEFIHRRSGRRGKFVSLNCASFQANLFESELFGYQKGAFTGAAKDTPGLFETAEGGTLFLDEIGDTPLELQPKLLRALEQGMIRRVGGLSEIPVNTRLVCATNRDLQELIREGRFREDLFYRINAFVVRLPALRSRIEDIPELAEHFLAQIAREAGTVTPALSPGALKVLQDYAWPGNVRELRSVLAFAAAQAGGRATIAAENLPAHLSGRDGGQSLAAGHLGSLFAEVSRHGFHDAQSWARFLLSLVRANGDNLLARGDMLPFLRTLRGPEPTDNSLVNEWQRTVKPAVLSLGLLHEEGKKVRVDLPACERASEPTQAEDTDQPETDSATASPQPALRQEPRRTNMAAHRTSFVGRQAEAAQLARLITDGPGNLVTVSGPGGTGKTRLAQEVARAVANQFPGGAWFADLTESRNIEGVAYAVARALGVPLTSSAAPEVAVAGLLESRGPTLLVLDNMEQAVRAAAPTVGNWAARAPNVKFVVTSRFLLGLEGEVELELLPLPLPADGASLADIEASAAGRLFIDRARISHLNFRVTAANAGAVVAICRRLEGMPLAIELAAARVAIMQPEQIAERLDKLFALLKSTRRDLAPRQQSLTATIDWSYDLLSVPEREAFAQLAAFRGGFHLEAAEAVLDLSGLPQAPPVMDLVQSLREKSLLRATDTPTGVHFAMYETIREYAAEKWQAMADAARRDELARRHARCFRGYLQQWDKLIFTGRALEALQRLELARANLEAALAWVAEQAGDEECRKLLIELTTASVNLLRVRGPARMRVPALRRALQACEGGTVEERVSVMIALGMAERESGDVAAGNRITDEALELATQAGLQRMVALGWFQKASAAFAEGRLDKAQEMHQRALELFRTMGDRGNEARVLSRMALATAHQGNPERALELVAQAEQMMRAQDDQPGLAQALTTRSNILFHRSAFREALVCINAAAEIYTRLDDRRQLAMINGNRALLSRQLRLLDDALRLMHETGEQAAELGDLQTLATNHMNMGLLYLDLDRLDDAERSFRTGAAMFEQQSRPHMRAVCLENLATLRALRGDVAGGIAEIRALLAGLDNDASLRGGVLVSLAELQLMAGDHAGALGTAGESRAALESAGITHNRDYFRSLLCHARALKESGQTEEARSLAGKAMALAGTLGFTAQDASPRVRRDLAAAESLL